MNINPVLQKEFKVKMRSWKIVALISAYLGVLALVTIFVVKYSLQDYSSQASASITMGVYAIISIIQFFLLVFISPALTSGAISGERERQTLDLLLCTRLKPISIIIGKLFSAISQIILLIVASIPIFSVVFLFGGISIGNVLQLILFYIILAILLGSIGIFSSTFFKKTTTSNVISYGIVLFLLFGIAFIGLFYTLFQQRTNIYNGSAVYNKNFFLSYINPLSGFISLLADQFGVSSSGNFMIPGVYMPGIRTMTSSTVYVKELLPFWAINSIINLLLSVLLLVASIFKLNPVKKTRTKNIHK